MKIVHEEGSSFESKSEDTGEGVTGIGKTHFGIVLVFLVILSLFWIEKLILSLIHNDYAKK